MTTPAPQPAPVPVVPSRPTLREQTYAFAKKCLGKDIARTQNELGCAEALSFILHSVSTPSFPKAGYLSTTDLYSWLKQHTHQVTDPLPGDVIISPSGTSAINSLHGHCGIVGYWGILSNNSMNGLFEEFYTMQSWEAYYKEKLHFPIYYFRVN